MTVRQLGVNAGPDVSVVIVAYNTGDALRDCLESVFAPAGGAELEVIVVDNASADGTPEMVRGTFAQVRLIANADNRGFAAGCNQGMAVSNGRYVLLLNPDTIVLDGAVSKTVAFADKRPDVGVVACQVLLDDGSVQQTCFRYPSLLNVLISSLGLDRLPCHSSFFGRENMADWRRDSEREVDAVTGCFMLVRRDALIRVGVMDERFFVYGEEADWCYRFRRAGWRVVFTPTAQIVHVHGGSQSTDQHFVRMRVQLRKSMLLFIEKHHGHFSSTCANVLCAFSALWHWVAWGLVGVARRFSRRSTGVAADKRAAYAAALRFHVFGVEPRP